MIRKLFLVFASAAAATLLLPAPAHAHPLGDFSVNQLVALTLRPGAVDATAILDQAELPTLQQRPALDTSGDGTADATELSRYAAAACGSFAQDIVVHVDGGALRWSVGTAAMTLEAGSAGLHTSRVTCTLSAPAALDRAAELTVRNGHLPGRVGWHEITAYGVGVALPGSPVPVRSATNELREYPVDLLGSPLDVREARISVQPAPGGTSDTCAAAGDPGDSAGSAGSAGPAGACGDAGRAAAADDPAPLRWAAWVQQRVVDAVGADRLTPAVGVLTVLLALVLGAGHALLPGHGKTVMAVYLAGRAGRPRDALYVGATVTATHTGGVIALGLLLTAVSGLTGQTVLGWLGLASGAIVVTVGLAMLRNARRPGEHGHRHGLFGRTHSHSHEGHHTTTPAAATTQEHAHPHGLHHSHPHPAGAAHQHTHPDEAAHHHTERHGVHHTHPHQDGVAPHHAHPRGVAHDHAPAGPGGGRWGIGAIGVAAGLVPSPSALVVLLGAIALGRTGFGILLVLAYGLGMAATLTAAGLVLLKVRDRWAGRLSRFRRLRLAGPYAAGAMVLLVGVGLAARAAALV
ncbi:hypothetical protein CS0771_02950 [Catellatospora sp. IY07-71]|uniref:hypothetical protein n=1 Tax=Catellatospora sp. IY07-71 TaxID=2728827 RepID=UPI001BB32E0E|nr:hypothetical protein [Catellatospora sp. IY07-71]BCJ70751.1 hypothetical protein CS0771_02950 [Catellatospora sp. IY07-71]